MTEQDLDRQPSGLHSARHPIGVVARRTALKPDVIRAWERRYRAILPARSQGRHRFYSDADIERLTLLRQATLGGRSIGQIAHLSQEDLLELVAGDQGILAAARRTGRSRAGAQRQPGSTVAEHLQACLAAIERLDSRDLELQLSRAGVDLSRPQLIEELLVPVLHEIGELWEGGVIRPMHEHLSSAVIRSFVGTLHSNAFTPDNAPHLVATTPAGQRHEMGALLAAGVASSEGWHVTYLGPDLPPEEIVAACRQKNARALALSIVYPTDDPQMGEALQRIRRHLPITCQMLVGGRGAPAYASHLEAIEAVVLSDLRTLRDQLRDLRGSG